MSGFLPQLVFLAFGGSIAPPLLLLTILFLGSEGSLPNATALVLGYFTTCTVMGIAGLTLFDETERAANTVRRRQVRVAERSIQGSCETVQNARRARLRSQAQTERLRYERILEQPGRRQVQHR
jgi:hypothetical protein